MPSGNGAREPLRVVAVVSSATAVPGSEARALAAMDESDAVDLVGIAVAEPARRPARVRDAVYRLYRSADERIFAGFDAAPPPVDLSRLPIDRPANTGEVDVVVCLAEGELQRWQHLCPRHGVWTLRRGGSAPPAAAFWEVHDGVTQMAVTLVALQDDQLVAVDRCQVAVDHLSAARTDNASATAAAELLARALQRLADGGNHERACDQPPPRPRGVPPVTTTIGHALTTSGRGVAARARSALFRDEWFVALRPQVPDEHGRRPLTVIENPAGAYYGDPFPFQHQGRRHLFFEDYRRSSRRGRISVVEVTSDGAISPPRVAVERDHHLSYPFVFSHEGAVYMIPETSAANRVELLRATSFPLGWVLDAVLLDGVSAADTTLLVLDGTFWLFTSIVGRLGGAGQLHLFWSHDLHGHWKAHPANPIVRDPGSARPAGRLLQRGRDLIRPGQDCTELYGRAVVLNRVDTISRDSYRERAVARIEPDWMPRLSGTHTYNADSAYEYLDGYRTVSRLARTATGR
ncbi:MAG TPA: hypothetical protein VGQ45_03815 [Gaiellales bacterium]|nr:hypothetical protein [Gaiellales bacterium]